MLWRPALDAASDSADWVADSKAGAPFAAVFFPKRKKAELWAGGALVVAVLAVSVSVPVLLLLLANWVSPWLRLILETMMCYQLLATKCLKDESMKVYHKLAKGDIPGARHMLSMIVGRDTERLQADGIAVRLWKQWPRIRRTV